MSKRIYLRGCPGCQVIGVYPWNQGVDCAPVCCSGIITPKVGRGLMHPVIEKVIARKGG
jgi:hypothetical protein